MKKTLLFITILAVGILGISLANIGRFFIAENRQVLSEGKVAELHETVVSETTTEVEVKEKVAEEISVSKPEIKAETEITEAEPVETEPTILPEMVNLLAENEDTFGWVTIGDIDNVVLQSDDNQYYLNHDFSKNGSWRGEIFADHRCNENSGIIIMYGHDNYDGSAFGNLDNFNFNSDNKDVSFSTLYEKRNYKVIGTGVVDYSIWEYHNELSVSESWIQNAEKYLNPEVALSEENEYLILSTCADSETERLVILCQRD